jgi:hypothetical protein
LLKTQYRDIVNIGYTRHRTETNKQKTQHIDTVNIGYTRHRIKANKQNHNTEILSTLGTTDTGQRQINKNTIQRYCQHWVHQTQDKDKQTKTQHRDTVNIGYTRHRIKTNKKKHNTEILSTLGTPDTGQR